jgi:hypothetical protein
MDIANISLSGARSTKTPARTWSALYQQRPAPEEGDYFHADWLRPYEAMPARETLKIYGASDYAVTADGGDYTVHIVVGIDSLCCMCWTSGARRLRPTSGSRPFSPAMEADRLGRGAGANQSGRGAVPRSADARAGGLCCTGTATRRCERNQSAVGWSSMACTSRCGVSTRFRPSCRIVRHVADCRYG